MILEDAALRRLVARAATLGERLGAPFEALAPATTDEREQAEARLRRWKTGSALGDEALFARRIAWDGLTPERALAIANGVRLADGAPLPGWTRWLQAGLSRAGQLADLDRAGLAARWAFLKPDEPCAFEQAFAPFVEAGTDEVRARVPDLDALAARPAVADMQRHLLQWLCAAGAETLGVEFNLARSLAPVGAGFQVYWFGMPAAGTPGTERYDAFVRGLLGGGLHKVVEEYAFLGRLLGRFTELWIEATVEFLDRLRADRGELQRAFGEGRELGRVDAAHAGLSDRHRGGRTTWRVRFESGVECIYKPKGLESERAFLALLEWLNAHGAPLPLHVFRAVHRPTHGWVEIVRPAPCDDEAAVARYYRRAGHMLALAYVLDGSDFHHENVIASGEHLVFIDLETILCHRVRDLGFEEEGASSLANRVFYWDSVFRTALLPRWEFGSGGEAYDVSGLGGVASQATSFSRKAWRHINTDGMELAREVLKTQPSLNVVRLGDQVVSPAAHVEEMVTGFAEMHRLLRERHSELMAGPLGAMARLPLRFIYRHTKVYTVLLGSYLLPQFLRDGFDASLQVDRLARPLLHTPEPHPFWPLVASESRQLLQGDIPLLGSWAHRDALEMDAGEELPAFFAEPSFDSLARRLPALDEADLARQVQYLRASFQAPDPGRPALRADDDGEPPALSDEQLVEAAIRLGDEMEASAIRAGGTATWITLQYHAEAQRWQLQPMAPRLYDGVAGTALFLAGLHRVSGHEGAGKLAREAFRGTLDQLEPNWFRLLFEPGVGAGLGATSLLYGLLRGGELLGDDEFVDAAVRGASAVTPERIAQDARLDLLGGAAGAAIVLLELHRARGGEALLELAVTCGRHLLAKRRGDGPRAWPTLNAALLCGLSHGAAGIVLALERLHAATGEREFLEAALEGRAWENAAWDEAEGNWPDFRHPKTARGHAFQATWCHGAPGIGLARCARPGGPDEEAQRDVLRAVEKTLATRVPELDHLCCGELGRVELLLEAGRQAGRADWVAEGRRRIDAVVHAASRRGRYALGFESGPNVPPFFQGTAGIGWALLRAARPELPSVLLWQ